MSDQTPNPNDMNNAIINQWTQDELDHMNLFEAFNFDNHGQRFGLHPIYRLPLLALSGSLVGGVSGMMYGYQLGGLKYLAMNAHRMPTDRNGWFYYHKRKNFVCLKDSFVTGFRQAAKVGLLVGTLFSLEAYFDYARGTIDFANTMMATTISGWIYANAYQLSSYQAKSLVKRGAGVGLLLGLLQDASNYLIGNDVWYLRVFFGINPRLSRKLS
ncbi:Hypothetical protein PP7435_CHR2-0547 [Komagataella phaffii CBS 7435]|uniref:Uncharacterized protein n=2 Tax=Komagataella phaffii TaxID=460519 RepID=C4R1K5_KOMPG|nr:Hypothetical protein PAS_chr2-1_0729 [Komagataella phaffii GS115]AOA62292.1 GQ67_00796T0 [Komagataella phaffii]CAH2448089.1 Hypothetical protein BQ9382_C2-2985 [Komagataella phaffii CBS 7435]AOA67049.1 GQ68_00593T0 [Komagataella phaffii GS115]CAY69379.1 Hypothetical protein PAS_chr2-1_0729 [Komagataella phaffii GS115]CCA38234.1 Hypothetical protein PP7435_CHR2-0547 [Komagataella phaffii CBS 7435]